MTVPVVLGIDPQWSRLGLALVEFEPPHRALWADTISINEKDGGWKDQQIAEALGTVCRVHNVNFTHPSGVGGRWSALGYEVSRIGIEKPATRYGAFDAGGAFHLTLAECRRRWPWAPQIVRQPSTWKKDSVGKGNATKAEVMEWAENIESPYPKPFQFNMPQDSADALGVAVSAAMVELEEVA